MIVMRVLAFFFDEFGEGFAHDANGVHEVGERDGGAAAGVEEEFKVGFFDLAPGGSEGAL